jgi:hypothetical protein
MFLAVALVLFFLPTYILKAQDPPGKQSAADLFEQTLAAEGLDAALAGLKEALSDTTEPYTIDGYELLIDLPMRLVLRHRHTEALALVKLLEQPFGEYPDYWFELGKAHIRCTNTQEAREALIKARDLFGNRPDIAWMVEHLEDLVTNAKLQLEKEEKLVPGKSTGLTGPYLGQSPPDRIPEVFAPGIISTTAHEYHISFAPDGREIYFSRSRVGTLVSRLEGDGWTAPEEIHFIDEQHLTEEANLTPDGQAVIFCGRSNLRSGRVLYRAERTADGWSAPQHLFPGMYATSTLEGTLYYAAHGEGRDIGVIVKRRWTGDGYGEPEVVQGEGINTDFPDAHPWIAPDESLLLFDSYRDPGMGIYASFRQSDGTWSPAVPLHDRLGIPPVGQCALSHDGKYLFFCMAGDMYWVDAGFLNELRPEKGRLDQEYWTERAQSSLKPFKQKLMNELVEGMKNGPEAAVDVCRVRAPEIADEVGSEGVRLGRTSHKLRNADNTPKEWMEPLLADYVATPGKSAPEVVRLDNGGVGYVEPIFVKPICLVCHGSDLSPSLESRLDEHYPRDSARGFEAGDFRGLFWVEFNNKR